MYTYITNRNSPNYTPGASVASVFGMARQIKGFTYHHWGDKATRPTFEGVVAWLTRPNGNTSAHYVVTGVGRRVACIVSPMDAAWHAGTALGNATTIGCELDAQETEEDYDVAAELSADLISAFGDQLKYPHNYWVNTACPGGYDVDRIDRMSYQKFSAADWGQGGDIKPPTPPPVIVVPPPAPVPPVQSEWIRNLLDITDVKLTVLAAAGVQRTNLITMQVVDDVIPKGTQIDIAKETTVGGIKYYISSYSANSNAAIGILAADLGIPAIPPVQEKPEWLKNLQDIADKDMWTRSEAPVLKLADGSTVERLPINTKVRITHSTQIVGINLLVLDGQANAIEPLYLSDTPISNPDTDLARETNSIVKQILAKLIEFITGFFSIFNKK